MASSEAGNTRLRSARQALGLRSQQALADAVTRAGSSIGLRISVTARTVRRWESEVPPWPHPEHQAALEALFQRAVIELGFTPPWGGGQGGEDPQQPNGSRTSSAAISSASVVSGPLTAFPPRSLRGPLPASIASDYIVVTSAYRHMYWVVPSVPLRDPVTGHVNLGIELLPSVPESSRRSLAAAISESSLLAGRIEFFDLQNPEKAQANYVVALQAAQDAGDPLLGAAALAHMAFIPAFSGDLKRAEEARDKVRAARAFARRGPASPDMLAWLDAVEAEAETRFGNTRKALQLIHHAEDIYANEESRPSPPWLDWFSPARLAGFKGNTLMTARQPGAARETLQNAIEQLPDEAVKQRSVLLADLAAVAVNENDAEQACVLAEAALDQLARTWYATGMDRVRTVRQSLAQWESLPCVRQLDERLYDWNTTVSALTG